MESPPRNLPAKREILLKLLEKSSARLFLDPRHEGVVVPKWFLSQPELVLRVGYELSPAIPDLHVGDDHLSCTLTFNRRPTWCKLPFSAIYAVISDADGRSVVWPEDVPVESQLLRSAGPKTPAPPKEKPAAARPARIRSVPPPPPAAEPRATLNARPGSAPAASPGAAPPGSAPAAPAGLPESHGAGGVKGTRRPLPPYLRVVK
jgi:stringent starvation protein B